MFSQPNMERLTQTQAKALEFIKGTNEHLGTAPTLRELCDHMGYSAIGSAQDLVQLLRRKGYLQIPEKQCARSLRVHQLHIPNKESVLIPAYNELPDVKNTPISCYLSLSFDLVAHTPGSQSALFALKVPHSDWSMFGFTKDDWLILNPEFTLNPGQIILSRIKNSAIAKRLLKDEKGWYLSPETENISHVRLSGEELYIELQSNFIGAVVALQRILNPQNEERHYEKEKKQDRPLQS